MSKWTEITVEFRVSEIAELNIDTHFAGLGMRGGVRRGILFKHGSLYCGIQFSVSIVSQDTSSALVGLRRGEK